LQHCTCTEKNVHAEQFYTASEKNTPNITEYKQF